MKEAIIQITEDGLYLTFDEYRRMKNSLPFTFDINGKYIKVINVMKYNNYLRKHKLEKLNETNI